MKCKLYDILVPTNMSYNLQEVLNMGTYLNEYSTSSSGQQLNIQNYQFVNQLWTYLNGNHNQEANIFFSFRLHS